MNRAYTLYCRTAAVMFTVNTLFPVMFKLAQQRLAHDWFHSFLHLMCALLGAYAGWRAKDVIASKVFTLSVGMLYFGLAVYGGFIPGLLLGSPLAIPLGVADNIFHLLLSLPALAILVLDLARLQRLNASQQATKLRMKNVTWIFGSLGFVIFGLGMLAAPAQWEGPVLITIGPGHALSVLDMIAIVPLLIGAHWLYLGLWQRRQRLYESLHQSPDIGCLGVFIAGLGLGLLVASSFSSFFWWWAIGALLFGAMLIIALILAL